MNLLLTRHNPGTSHWAQSIDLVIVKNKVEKKIVVAIFIIVKIFQ